MKNQGLALHEALQLHEIVTLKTLCLTKSATMSPLAADEELKKLLQDDVKQSAEHIKALRDLITDHTGADQS